MLVVATRDTADEACTREDDLAETRVLYPSVVPDIPAIDSVLGELVVAAFVAEGAIVGVVDASAVVDWEATDPWPVVAFSTGTTTVKSDTCDLDDEAIFEVT